MGHSVFYHPFDRVDLEKMKMASLDQPNYQAARMKMAQIYLEEKHDRHKFSICYRDILDHDPSPQAYVLLGDAYMSIQEVAPRHFSRTFSQPKL